MVFVNGFMERAGACRKKLRTGKYTMCRWLNVHAVHCKRLAETRKRYLPNQIYIYIFLRIPLPFSVHSCQD